MIGKISRIIHSLSRTERQILIGAALIFIAASIFWGVFVFVAKTELKPAAGGSYIEGLIDQPTAVNPVIAAGEADRDLTELLFADLFDLIEKYSVSDDQRIWTFDLKPDMVWSDGEPITAGDFIFTLELIQNPETRSPLFATWQGVVGERISERQFRFLLKTPYAFFMDNLKVFKPIPQHIFEKIPAANIRLSNYNFEPVGSGPYRYAGFDKRKDGFITAYYLTANSDYSADKAYIKNFTVKFFSNKEDLIAAFNKKEITGMGGLGYPDIAEIKIAHQVFKLNLPVYYSVFFNQALNAALKEKEVRQALALASDKNKIIAEVFANQATAVHGPIPPFVSGYDPAVYQAEEFSLEKAQKILDDKGWELNENGVRAKTLSGKKTALEFELVVPQVDFLVKTADILKKDWEAVGIKINPITLRLSEVVNNIIKTRNYQMLLFGSILKTQPDIFSFWHSSERFYPGGNLAIFNNKTTDTLLEAVKTSFDEKIRQENLSKIQTIINQEKPAVFLFSPTYFYIATNRLGGFEEKIIATRTDRLQNVNRWYLETKRKFR